MKKPKYLYNGSGRKLVGTKLMPKIPKDLGKEKANKHKGVYATSNKDEAIIMGIISGKEVNGSGLRSNGGKVIGIVYDGWPKNKYFYLYTLSSNNFRNMPKGSNQWISFNSVKPFKIEKLKIKDYLELIRKATKKENKKFNIIKRLK